MIQYQWVILFLMVVDPLAGQGTRSDEIYNRTDVNATSSAVVPSSTYSSMVMLVTTDKTLAFTSPTMPSTTDDQVTTHELTGFDLFWSMPLNQYLVYGGAGGLVLILLFILFCIIATVRGCRHKRHSPRNNLRSGAHEHCISLMDRIQPLENSIDEDELMEDKTVLITEFGEHISEMRANANSGFEDEFDTLARITRKKPSYAISQMPENEPKNRFDNVFPFDCARVVLTKIEDDPYSDYINASYIDGHGRENAYIASQGPLPGTIADFWRMIWEFKLTTVIMLTETMEAGKEKCQKYWPSALIEQWDVGYSLVVTLTEQIPFAEYQVKIMKVENKMDPESCVPFTVTHYHFSAWPDHGVPADKTSLIHFIQLVRRHHPYFNSPPLLVHCSAGVGRTGTFITLDSMIQRMKTEDTLDIFAFVRQMRRNRPLMVQTEEQYIFIHEALEEFITCGDTSIGTINLRVAIAKMSKALSDDDNSTHFDRLFEVLDKVSCKMNSINCTEGKKPYNAKKNRYPECAPYNVSRVILKPSAVKGSDYINASFIDGYKQQRAFIAAQTPLKSTVNEFWRMVWENKCRAIVMLCDMDREEMENHCVYWPTDVRDTVVYGRLKVTLLSEESDHEDDITIRKLELREDTQYHVPGVIDYLVMTLVQHNDWPEDEVPSTKSVMKAIDTLLKIQRSTGNQAIVVCCNNGMGRTGTFITIFSQLERIKTESICDVFQCVKAMRLQRPSMVQDVEQLIFCYQVLVDYLDTMEHYANFK